MVCAVWWYQKFAYLCCVDECTLLHCPPFWVLNLNELMLTDVRDYLRNLATSNKGGEVKTSSPSFWEFCIKTSVKASAVNRSPSANC